jgi:hypothetical protein
VQRRLAARCRPGSAQAGLRDSGQSTQTRSSGTSFETGASLTPCPSRELGRVARRSASDAIVTEQVLRRLGRRPFHEIRWSAHGRQALVRADTHAITSFAICLPRRTPASSLGDDIDEAVVDLDLDFDVWVLRRDFASFGRGSGTVRRRSPLLSNRVPAPHGTARQRVVYYAFAT